MTSQHLPSSALPACDPFGAPFRWHGCPLCTRCTARNDAYDWSFVDAVYCISLEERPDRTKAVAERLRAIGLCRRAKFLRVHKAPPGKRALGIWTSHRLCALDARARGFARVLILEDDAVFLRTLTPNRLARIARDLRRLPPDWRCLYLGEFPIEARFFRRGILRVSAGCTHAYIASRRLIDWLADNEPFAPNLRHRPFIGNGVDARFASLDGMYATFPMVATQSGSVSDNIDPRRLPNGQKRPWTSRYRYEHLLISGMRAAELGIVLLMPLQWLYRRVTRTPFAGR